MEINVIKTFSVCGLRVDNKNNADNLSQIASPQSRGEFCLSSVLMD